MFKTETHLHTKEVSVCGHIEAAEMISRYHAEGYSTVFVSDHFYSPYFEKFPELTWAEKIDEYLKGYRAAKQRGDKIGVEVLLSCELRIDCIGNDYLLYGIDEDMLKNDFEGIFSLNCEEMKKFMDDRNIFVVQAHPYRAPKSFPDPKNVDAIEVLNTNPRHFVEEDQKAALDLAKENNLFLTGGSDAHRLEDIAGGGVYSEEKITCAEDYIKLLKSGIECVIGL